MPLIYKASLPDYYLRHLPHHHSSKCTAYDGTIDGAQKLDFLINSMSFSNNMMNHFSTYSSNIIQIHAHIVDELLLQYYVDYNFDSVSLLRDCSKTDEIACNVRVNNTTHFNLCVKQVSTGMCFTQTVSSVRITKQFVGGDDLNVITDAVVRTFGRSTGAVNLQ